MSQPCERCNVPTDHRATEVRSRDGDSILFTLCGGCLEAWTVPFARQGFRMIRPNASGAGVPFPTGSAGARTGTPTVDRPGAGWEAGPAAGKGR